MANNRGYFLCVSCAQQPDAEFSDFAVSFLKYYPSEGWYAPEQLTGRLNEWFARHKHQTLWGDFIVFVTETQIGDSVEETKRRIVEALAKPSEEQSNG